MAVCIFHRHLKGLEVNFTDGLLVGPSSQHGITVALLVVQSEVFHTSIHTVLLCSLDCIFSHRTRENAILRVILKVTACKGSAVDVHSRTIPAGGVHLIGHLADAVTKRVSKVFAPSHADEGSCRETDRADTGKVVVDGSGTVAGIGAHFTDAVHGRGLIAAEADGLLQVVKGHLVQQVIPLGIVVVHTTQVCQLDAILCPSRDVLSVGVVVQFIAGFRVGEAVIKASLDFITHFISCRSSGRLVIVGKAVGAGQISEVTLCKIKLVGSSNSITFALVVGAIDNIGSNRISFRIQHIV